MSKDIVSLIAAISHDECKKDRDRDRCLLQQYRSFMNDGWTALDEQICEKCKMLFVRDDYEEKSARCCSCGLVWCKLTINGRCNSHDVIHDCASKETKWCLLRVYHYCNECLGTRRGIESYLSSSYVGCDCETCQYIRTKHASMLESDK